MALDTCLKHHFLLAMPRQESDYFSNTITYICEHNEEGAMGFMVNRPMKLTVADLLEQLGISGTVTTQQPVMEGGPVKTERGFILHSPDWGGEDSVHVGDRWVLSATIDILRAIAEGKGPTRWVAALGYAGWGAGQLEQEMTSNGWFTTPGNDDLLYECDVASRWEQAFRTAGVDARLLTADFGTA